MPENINKTNQTSDNTSKIESKQKFEEVVSYLKMRGFIFPSSEIYGGMSGVYDYGH